MPSIRRWLALVTLTSACAGGGEPEWTGTVTAPALTTSGSSEGTTDLEPGWTTTTGSPDPVPTTMWNPDPTSTGSSSGTSLDPTGTSTSGLDTAGTTGEPVDPCPRVRVTVVPGDTLNVRPQPSTAMDPIASLGSGVIVDVLAIVQGELIDGLDTWYRIAGPWDEGYVFGGFVECTLDEPPDEDGFFLPLQCGTTTTVTQGNFGDFSHQGNSAYAFDFSLAMGTPLVAIADGTVTNLYGETMPGDPCYNGGGQECNPYTNYVTLLHGDGTSSVYAHLSACRSASINSCRAAASSA